MKKNMLFAVVAAAALMMSACSDPLKDAVEDALSFKSQTKVIANDWSDSGYTVSSAEVTSGRDYVTASVSTEGTSITSVAEGKATVKFTSSEYKAVTADLTVDVDSQGYPWMVWTLKNYWIDNPDANAPKTYDGTYLYEYSTGAWKLKINGNIVWLILKNNSNSVVSFVRGFYTVTDGKLTVQWKSLGGYLWYTDKIDNSYTQTDDFKTNEDGTPNLYADANWVDRTFSVDNTGDMTINISDADIKFVKQ